MPDRRRLRRALKYLSLVLGFGVVYVLLDFTIDTRPSRIQDSYQFSLGGLPQDRAVILRQDNLSILIIRRSGATLETLIEAQDLQDPLSNSSRQPELAQNPLRSTHPEYFVSYAIGTDLGCGLREIDGGLQEICGDARYDFAGRALGGDKSFPNLTVPDYNFSNDFSTLSIRP